MFWNSRTADAHALSQDFEALQACLPKTLFHVKTFLGPVQEGTGEAATEAGREAANWDAQYHTAYAAALEKAIQASRVPAEVRCLPAASRASASLKGVGPWQAAQIDVYQNIALSMGMIPPGQGSATLADTVLADVGQTTTRGTIRGDGSCATVTTSSVWFDYQARGFVAPKDFFALHGHTMKKLTFAGLTSAEIRSLAGNGMTTTMMALALTPVLHELGYLRKVAPTKP